MIFCVIFILRVKYKFICIVVFVNNWSCLKVNKNLRFNSFLMEVRVLILSVIIYNSLCIVVFSLEYCYFNMIILLLFCF